MYHRQHCKQITKDKSKTMRFKMRCSAQQIVQRPETQSQNSTCTANIRLRTTTQLHTDCWLRYSCSGVPVFGLCSPTDVWLDDSWGDSGGVSCYDFNINSSKWWMALTPCSIVCDVFVDYWVSRNIWTVSQTQRWKLQSGLICLLWVSLG